MACDDRTEGYKSRRGSASDCADHSELLEEFHDRDDALERELDEQERRNDFCEKWLIGLGSLGIGVLLGVLLMILWGFALDSCS